MTSADRELVGRTLGGRFRLTELLGEGAMAAVYRAEQDGEPRQVAVKVMHTELLVDPTFAKRFAREAKTAARIVHPNSVRILEHGADGRHLYLAMELLEGQDLFDLLARERRLGQPRAAGIVIQICDALSAAHAHGIVHRDLKPENVMILRDPATGGDLVKVLDFGIAKILERDADAPTSSEPIESQPPSSALTRVGGLVGTPEYMSPEQAMASAVDARSDVYSCGALLFHALTGRQPFMGSHPLEVLMQIPDKPAPAPSSVLASIDAEMDRIVLKSLSKAPEQRQQSAAELAAELRAFVARDGAGVGEGVSEGAVRGAIPSLPGVPEDVLIGAREEEEPSPPSSGDRPPATLRSGAQGSHAGVPEPAATAPEAEAVTEEPANEALPDKPAPERAATMGGAELVVPLRKPVPAWMFLVAAAVLFALVCLVRWLGFG